MAARVKIGWIEAIPEEEAPAEDGEAVVEEEGTA